MGKEITLSEDEVAADFKDMVDSGWYRYGHFMCRAVEEVYEGDVIEEYHRHIKEFMATLSDISPEDMCGGTLHNAIYAYIRRQGLEPNDLSVEVMHLCVAIYSDWENRFPHVYDFVEKIRNGEMEVKRRKW